MDATPLLSTPHFALRALEGGIVVVERTPEPFASRQAMDETMHAVGTQLDRLSRRDHGLLVDLRSGPSRNDAEFERRFSVHRKRMQKGFRSVAIVVRSAAGKLQVQRLASEDGIDAEAFTDVGAAIAWLRESTD